MKAKIPILFNFNSTSNLLKLLLLFSLGRSPLVAEYIESTKYRFSFFVDESFHKERIKNNYGPFFQFSSNDKDAFIHFWVRDNKKGLTAKYLLNAYSQDFLSQFVSLTTKVNRPTTNWKLTRRNNNTKAKLFTTQVKALDSTFQVDAYIDSNNRSKFIFVFIYEGKGRKKYSDIFESIINSLIY